MKNSRALYDLIQSLTGTEKRYFRLVTDMYKGEKNYLKVFDVYNKQGAYDEKTAREAIGDEKLLRQLHFVKSNLTAMILKSMAFYHRGSNVRRQAIAMREEIEFLQQKGLFNSCMKMIRKARKLCQTYELYSDWLEITDLELSVLFASARKSGLKEKVAGLYDERRKVAELLVNRNDYLRISDLLYSIYLERGVARTKEQRAALRRVMQDPLLKDESKAKGFMAKHYFYASYCYYHDMIGDHASAYRYQKKIVELFNAHREHVGASPLAYIAALNNIVWQCVQTRHYDEMQNFLDMLRKIHVAGGLRETRVFESYYLYQMLRYVRLGEFEQGRRLIPEIEQWMEAHRGVVGKQFEMGLHFLVSVNHFGAGDLHQALKWLNRLLSGSQESIRSDKYVSALIYNMVLHLELGNEIILPSLIRSNYRFLRRRDRLYDFEGIIFKYIQRLLKTNSRKETKRLYADLKRELEKSGQSPEEQETLTYFDLAAWLDSKLEGISFREAVRRRAAGYRTLA